MAENQLKDLVAVNQLTNLLGAIALKGAEVAENQLTNLLGAAENQLTNLLGAIALKFKEQDEPQGGSPTAIALKVKEQKWQRTN